ncbi:MAG TPA: hypothetical protein VF066_15795 [Thermoleophilaceae bacterium]
MRGALRTVAVAAVLTVAVPAVAEGATTVGSSLRQRANLYLRCSSNCTAVQTARPGGAGLSMPSDGVISRWRVRAATMGSVRLRVMRPEADGGYTAVMAGDWIRLDRPHAPGQDVLYEFPARMSVRAGDVIALDRDAKAGGIFHSYGDNTTYAAAEFAPSLRDDALDVKPSSNVSGRELLLNADVEKDADGDGFGDESQDNCPTIANDQTDKPCTTPTPESTTPQGPTSQTVETTPQTRTQGSAGPPVAGERPLAKSKRRHSRRRGARRSPPRAGDPQRTHGGKPKPRSAPRKPSRRESDSHGTAPKPRPKPVERKRQDSKHPRTGPRPKPPTPRAPSGEPHGNQPARPAPRNETKQEARGHRNRKGARSAPHPRPLPGWRHHSV